MAEHKKQHFVAASYLKSWCDPATPADQTPYVWVFSKDGKAVERKSPSNIFHETDMYTIESPSGGRDLRLEHGLGQLESKFSIIRQNKLELYHELDADDHLFLCAFIAAAFFRTPAHREHVQKQWSPALKMMDEMKEWAKTATIEEKRAASAASIPSSVDRDRSLSYEQVKDLHDKPLQKALSAQVSALTPLLMKMDLAVLENDSHMGFITSDNPCVWFDPQGYKRPPLYRGPALMYETIEITLPLSPRQCIFLNRKGVTGYIAVSESTADDFNRRTRFSAHQNFVTRRNLTKIGWFDVGQEPSDSWENTHKRSTKDN